MGMSMPPSSIGTPPGGDPAAQGQPDPMLLAMLAKAGKRKKRSSRGKRKKK